jgi:hypothetical protein
MLQKLQEIRQADRPTRIRWVIILSTISTIIVIFLWVGSLKVITAKIESGDAVDATGIRNISAGIGAGFSELKLRTKNAFDYFAARLGDNEVELTPPAEDQPAP